MAPEQPPRSWQDVIARQARTAGVDLAPATIDELAAHLEDAYVAALQSRAERGRGPRSKPWSCCTPQASRRFA